jgi:hypothetical protein
MNAKVAIVTGGPGKFFDEDRPWSGCHKPLNHLLMRIIYESFS